MARARNIKPGFFKNDELAQCSHGARLLFAGLWTLADREGRLEDRPLRIKGELFPYEECDVGGWLNQLAAKRFIVRYEVDGCKYIQINTFAKHQNPHCKEPASSIPAPCEHGARTVPAGLIPDSLLLIPDSLKPITEGSPDGECAKKRSSRFVPPTVEEVANYCAERQNGIDPQYFVDSYQAKGWMVGRNKMTDWKASVRTWERNNVRQPIDKKQQTLIVEGISGDV